MPERKAAQATGLVSSFPLTALIRKVVFLLITGMVLQETAIAAISKGTAAKGKQSNGTSVSAQMSASGGSLLVACVMMHDKSGSIAQVSSLAPSFGWGRVSPPVTAANYGALEVWAAYTASAVSNVTVTAQYSGGADATLVIQQYRGTASSSTYPLAGIGGIASNVPSTSSSTTVTVSSTGHKNSLYMGCAGIDNEKYSSFWAGSGYRNDGSIADGTYVSGAIESATAIQGTPANKRVSFSHKYGSRGYLTGIELIDATYDPTRPPSVSFSANPASISAGASSTLSWSVSNASSVTLDNGIGTVASSGSVAVSPTTTTTFTLTATGTGGTKTSQAKVTVTAPAPTVSFSADPSSVSPGGSATLSWSVTSATSVTIDNAIGTVASSGNISVTPTATTTYTLTATGAGGTSTARATVAVSQVTYNATIAAMLEQVTQADMTDGMNKLTGVTPAVIGGVSRTLGVRVTGTTNSSLSTQWAYERGTAAGLSCGYENWGPTGGYSDRNLVCSKTGTLDPSKIVVLSAHVDTVSGSVGANDNASGAVAVMRLMEIMAAYSFQRTLRFILWTGEEQGHYGSQAYVAAHDTDDYQAVLVLEYLGYDGGDHALTVITHLGSSPAYGADHELAQVAIDVSSVYSLVAPAVENKTSGTTDSDHASFWANGNAALLGAAWALNYAYYHSPDDTADKLDMVYYTTISKTLLATVAHWARLSE